jgi:hypothetical protein
MGRKLKVECECGDPIGDSPYKIGSMKICRRCKKLPISSEDISDTAGHGQCGIEMHSIPRLQRRMAFA